MINQLQTWYIITTKEKLAIKAYFLAPRSDTPNPNFTTFACQLDMCQVECKEHKATVT